MGPDVLVRQRAVTANQNGGGSSSTPAGEGIQRIAKGYDGVSRRIKSTDEDLAAEKRLLAPKSWSGIRQK